MVTIVRSPQEKNRQFCRETLADGLGEIVSTFTRPQDGCEIPPREALLALKQAVNRTLRLSAKEIEEINASLREDS